METLTSEILGYRPICGVWRRLAALFIDSIALGLLGMCLGTIFGQQFALLGALGPLVGFSISACYFGIMNSYYCNGQSIGKKLLKICVVTEDGELISMKRSIVRAVILSAIVCKGLSFATVPIIGQLIDWIILMIFFGTVYFYIFNKKTRQGIHDIICGTYVYNVTALNTPISATVSKMHYIICSVVLIVFTLVSYMTMAASQQNELFSIYKELTKLDGVYAAKVDYMTAKHVFNIKTGVVDGKESTRLTASVYVHNIPINAEELKDKVARVVLENYPAPQNIQTVMVNVYYGYNIGIASNYAVSWSSAPIQKWKEKLHIFLYPHVFHS
ncbi:MAG TPA: RDD family protein [Methylomusa anaerophila]|uniref:RDD family protein n=1 Tax=Methylomusa anaerophila TaxID=1930071 RepID=A0A348AMF9_9FIRM|nr:RDD family protein [Methylomusa anaerophila]BBB92257.1 RDD family protein [Methylomusa anaerophila]HML90284.1 RDD family protein [Methylomusa anaerophila]